VDASPVTGGPPDILPGVPLSHDSPPRGAVPASPAERRLPGAVPAVALLAVLAVSVAQSATAAVLPATTRELGLGDWQAGAVTSATAAVVVLTSAAWGRRADRLGPRVVVLAGGAAGALGTLGVAAVLAAGPDARPGLAWAALVLARGLVFGLAVAAVGPAVQALLVTGAAERERVAWIARGGAARGLGTMAGAGLAAALGALGAVLPVLAAAGVLAAAVLGFALVVRRARTSGDGPTAPAPVADPGAPGRAVRRSSLRVRGVRTAAVASAAVFLAMAFVQSSVGFLVQDRYGVTAGRATALTGLLLLVAGLGSVLAQGVLVPRLGWSPWRLVRVGGAVVVAAVAVYALPVPVPVLVAVALVFGAGVGAAAAGCTSAAAAAAGPAGQGDVAGLVNAVNALTFVVGPALATSAYGLHPALPAAGALLAGLVTLVAAARGRA
jgi:MFS family permease